MVGMRPMEQRRGREFTGEFLIVGVCENFVANGLSDTGWIFGTDLDIGTDLCIGTDWIFGTDLVIGSGFIIGTVWTSIELIVIDSGGREVVHRCHRCKGDQLI